MATCWQTGCKSKLSKDLDCFRLHEVTCLHHAFLDRLDTEPDLRHLKFRVGGLVGPHVIFPYAEDLVAHIASSKKYRRTNPLDSEISQSSFGVLFCWFVCLVGTWIGWFPCVFFSMVFDGLFRGFWWFFHGCWWFSHGFHVCLMDFWWFSRGFSWFGSPWPSAFKGRCDSPRTQRILA